MNLDLFVWNVMLIISKSRSQNSISNFGVWGGRQFIHKPYFFRAAKVYHLNQGQNLILETLVIWIPGRVCDKG